MDKSSVGLKHYLLVLREKLAFAEPVIRWVLVSLGLEKDDPIDFAEELKEFNDPEYWKSIKDIDFEYESGSEVDEKYPEGPCVDDDDDRLAGCKVADRIMPVGTRWTDKRTCIYYECKEFNRLQEVHCPEWCPECHISRCKEIPGDPNANYPDCCPTVQCEPPKFRNFAELEAIADQCKHPRDCC
ncbi:uncharacterized protein LOC128998931 [Macrosteles quadrilineatus]|uniref:uncharacterized protein LOC128998931 n=1 Tax=Macrosteles quadrilineatus TaxID=74068 RepID=UPI0023E2E98A|nr:uncharacterized protein LOC128998931 [Macrosteles quadrilineatus]